MESCNVPVELADPEADGPENHRRGLDKTDDESDGGRAEPGGRMVVVGSRTRLALS